MAVINKILNHIKHALRRQSWLAKRLRCLWVIMALSYKLILMSKLSTEARGRNILYKHVLSKMVLYGNQ